MSINCLIVDDEPLARELLEAHISKLPLLRLVASCENALNTQACLEQNKIDLIFLDIEMPLLKGNSFLRGLADPPAAIMTTAHREYAVESYEMNVIDYLLKPIVFERFFKAVEKFRKQHVATALPEAKTDDHIFVPSGGRHIRLSLTDILFIESSKDYITIHTRNAPDIRIKHNISAFEKLLDERFLRVHRSYIINRQKITSFSRSEVWIGAAEIPIGDSYRDNWKSFLDQAATTK